MFMKNKQKFQRVQLYSNLGKKDLHSLQNFRHADVWAMLYKINEIKNSLKKTINKLDIFTILFNIITLNHKVVYLECI